MPARGLAELAKYRKGLGKADRGCGSGTADLEEQEHKLLFAKFDEIIDTEPVVRHLQDPALADEVRSALYHFADERYGVLAWVIMPSHLHWVFRPIESWVASLGAGVRERSPRERIIHSVNRHGSRQCNKLLGTAGAFWQDESYDHCVRDGDELWRIIEYVQMNPVKAGLAEAPEAWQFSSARDRADWDVPWGEALAPSK